jgi:hypothetical protein
MNPTPFNPALCNFTIHFLFGSCPAFLQNRSCACGQPVQLHPLGEPGTAELLCVERLITSFVAIVLAPLSAQQSHVNFQVTPLDPSQNPGWETLEYAEPIPMGRDLGSFSSPARDYDFTLCAETWINAGTGDGEQSQIFRNNGVLTMMMLLAGLNPSGYVRDGDELQEAIDDCVSKFRWIPSLEGLPCYLCFAFCFNRCALVLIQRDGPPEIFHLPISTQTQKITFLRRAVTYARVLRYFVDNDIVSEMGLKFGIWHTRKAHMFAPDGKKEILLNFAGFQAKCENKPKFVHLQQFYQECSAVPHMEHVREVFPNDNNFFLSPIGSSARPK